MKKYIILLFLSAFFSLNCFSQKNTYLNRRKEKTTKSAAYFVRKTSKKKNSHLIEEFILVSKQKVRSYEVAQSDHNLLNGFYNTWYSNGKKKAEGFYKFNRPSGTWKRYYQNGQKEIEYTIKNGKEYYHQHWDQRGKAKLINGTGTYYSKVPNSNYQMQTEYLDSIKLRSFYVTETADSIYLEATKRTSYKGGRDQLYNLIGTHINYPIAARRLGINGTVQVGFFVDEKGNIVESRIIKGLSRECDQEALRIVFLSKGNWEPAHYAGKSVKFLEVLPIHFILNK